MYKELLQEDIDKITFPFSDQPTRYLETCATSA